MSRRQITLIGNADKLLDEIVAKRESEGDFVKTRQAVNAQAIMLLHKKEVARKGS